MKKLQNQAASAKKYRLFMCFDFPDDLIATAFTRQSLEALFRLYRSWGVERIYWIYTWQHSERLWECVPTQAISWNYAVTRRRLGEFLPVAVEIAHALSMEIYAVYKPFDMGFDETYPAGTSPARRFGRLDSLSGRVHWAAASLVRHRALRIQRRWDDVPSDLERRRIGAIVLRSDRESRLNPAAISLEVSRDNNRYHPYRGPVELHQSSGPAGQTIRLDGLQIKEPYVAIRAPGHGAARSFSNSLDKLVTVLDKQGQPLPFTYGLYSRAERLQLWKNTKAGSAARSNMWPHGYVFNWHNAARRNFLSATRYSVDNEKGFLALAKGKERYVTGALSPAYPEVRQLWLRHVGECLDAGVDGVDLRVGNHNRSLEWENYGFEPPVRDAFIRLYGRAPGRRAGDAARCRKILGERYTEFIKAAAALIRRRGRRVQLHLGQGEIAADYFPIQFEWERWLREGLADEITLMTDYPSHFYRKIAAAAARHPVPMYFRKYIKAVTYRKRWQEMLRRYLRQSRALGQAGFIVYESSFVVQGQKDGAFKVLHPDVPRILKAVLAERS